MTQFQCGKFDAVSSVLRFLVSVSVMLTVGGCASVEPLPIANSHLRGHTYKEDKLLYSETFRCFTYEGKPLIDEITGRKIRERGQAIETLEFLSNSPSDRSGSSLSRTLMTLEAPYLVAAAAVGGVLRLPYQPVEYLVISHYKRESVDNYRKGITALEENNCGVARKAFLRAADAMPSLPSQSDLYYQIARTYSCEGKEDLEKEYYEYFLNFAFNKYPDYFSKYDKNLNNNVKDLQAEFSAAEVKLGLQAP